MRDPETERLLTDVRRAVVAARAGGVTAGACLFDAVVAAVDETERAWPSREARRIAVATSRAVEIRCRTRSRLQILLGWFNKSITRGFN